MNLRWQEILGVSFTILMYAVAITAFFLVVVLCLSLLKAGIKTLVSIFKDSPTPEVGNRDFKSVK